MPPCTLAAIVTPSEALIGVGVIAAWLVMMCLKTLAFETGHAMRVHNLKVEAHRLRLQQRRRLKELGTKASPAKTA